MLEVRVFCALLLCVWYSHREALGGYERVNGGSYQVPYNTSSRQSE